MAASETELPKVIVEHWLPVLQEEGLLVECSPDQFTAPADWIPQYTRDGLQKYLPAALSAFPNQGVLSLIAVMPPEVWVGTDKEFLLCNFNHHGCLVRQSFSLDGRHKQLTFCPYCGVINKNSDTTLSHVRKHLDLQFVCGGCFSRSFLNGPTQQTHEGLCLGNHHQRLLQTVGLLQWTPSSNAGLQKVGPPNFCGDPLARPPS